MQDRYRVLLGVGIIVASAAIVWTGGDTGPGLVPAHAGDNLERPPATIRLDEEAFAQAAIFEALRASSASQKFADALANVERDPAPELVINLCHEIDIATRFNVAAAALLHGMEPLDAVRMGELSALWTTHSCDLVVTLR
jgi:hypothetical protein